jgi:histidine triad (HIT) family protein
MRNPATTRSADCDFCKIAVGEDTSTQIVCTGASWVAFFPLNPAVLGHTLIIPRIHVTNLWDVEPHQGAELFNAVSRVGKAIRAALSPDGMNLITSDGEAAEQTVFHLHLHLIPRWYRDDFGPIWPHDKNQRIGDLSNAADQIRHFCEGSV